MDRNGSKQCPFSQVMGQDDEKDSVIDDIFASYAKLSYAVYLEQFDGRKPTSWIFSAPELRKRIFAKAEIKMRHFK